GNAIDYDFVRRAIVDDSKIIKIGLIGIDAQFQGLDFAMRLEKDLGHTEKSPVVIVCSNTAKKISPVCQEFERRLLKRKLNHGGNPVLRFMADSVALRAPDVDGCVKPDKDKSQGKIDCSVAMLYAMDRLIRSKPPAKIIMPTTI
ncbi:MAG: terminase TerL endonuclease subunit, partial [bacterium]